MRRIGGMDDEPARECAFCDRAWGFIGLSIAIIIGAVGLDLLLGGALTKAVFPRTWQEATDDSGT
jgi:hypothetical protein